MTMLLPFVMMLAAPGQEVGSGSCETVPTEEIAFRAGEFDGWLVGSDIRAGTSDVRWVAGGCALMEDWTGAVSGAGSALYAYHTGRWHLYFVNSTGHTLMLNGFAERGQIVFEGDHPDLAGRQGAHRMIFAPEGADVRQTWHFRPDTTGEWELVVDMIQRRRPLPE